MIWLFAVGIAGWIFTAGLWVGVRFGPASPRRCRHLIGVSVRDGAQKCRLDAGHTGHHLY